MNPPLQLQSVRCNLCGSDHCDTVATGDDREYETSSQNFRMVRCRNCELVYLNPRPCNSELSRIYPQSYLSYDLAQSSSPQKKSTATRIRQWVYSRRLRKAFASVARREKIDLLDIGCGDGWMLDCYQTLKPGSVFTYGVEIDDRAAKACRSKGHTVFIGKFQDIAFGDQKFDFINLSHVIEHVDNPREFLEKIGSLLKPGGRVAVETPNIESLDGKFFRRGNWGAYHFPRHWWIYEPNTLRALISQAGFHLDELHFHAAPVHWHWTSHNLFLSHRLLRPFANLFAPDLIFKSRFAIFYLTFFSMMDWALLLFRQPTSNMMAILSRPEQELTTT